MELFNVVLFIHIACAILLVGGSLWVHVGHGVMHRARTVDGALTQARFIALFARAGGPLAAGTLLAGVYLAFAADRWDDGWLIVSLALFVFAGAAFGTTVSPGAARQVELLTSTPDGPLTPAVRAALHDRRYEAVMTVMAGADAAILFLMTNKPGLLASVGVAVIGLALGAVVATTHGRRAAPAPEPA